MLLKRTIQDTIERFLFKGKVIIIYGARRVGKTTLSKQILQKYPGSKYINCELLQYKTMLETTNSDLLKDFFGNTKLIVLDEAQSIANIGKVLKVVVDTFSDIQVIATGSSSFDLSGKIAEPLTGRSRQFILFPLSMEEWHQQRAWADIHGKLGHIMQFGLYPEVFDKNNDDATEELFNIASNYLYKDILQFENLRRTDLILKLLQALALQLGSECSYNELSRLLGENVHTIQKYIELLEKTFIIFRLNAFSRNLRNELGKSQKIYFYDLGIRNALIQNFNDMSLRSDTGALWENFCITERLKTNHNRRRFVNTWFWRTYNQKEIDYIEEFRGKLQAFEFKWNRREKVKNPVLFLKNYENSSFTLVNPGNYLNFIRIDA